MAGKLVESDVQAVAGLEGLDRKDTEGNTKIA